MSIDNNLFSWLRKDMHQFISRDLSLSDITRCSQVCKAWKTVFDADYMWERAAKELDIKPYKPDILVQMLIHSISFIPNLI